MNLEKLLFSLRDLDKVGNDVMACLIISFFMCCYLIVEIASLRPGRDTEIWTSMACLEREHVRYNPMRLRGWFKEQTWGVWFRSIEWVHIPFNTKCKRPYSHHLLGLSHILPFFNIPKVGISYFAQSFNTDHQICLLVLVFLSSCSILLYVPLIIPFYYYAAFVCSSSYLGSALSTLWSSHADYPLTCYCQPYFNNIQRF